MSTKCCSSSGDPPLLPVTKYVYKPLYQSWVSHAKKVEQMGAPPRLGKGPHSLAADDEAQLRGRNQTHRFTHHRHNSASGIFRKSIIVSLLGGFIEPDVGVELKTNS